MPSITPAQWNWSTPLRNTLYIITFVFFLFEIATEIRHTYKTRDVQPSDLYAGCAAVAGFATLFVFQYNAKWIVGITLIGILMVCALCKLILMWTVKRQAEAELQK